jgi:predicted nucleotidyltransferase component of viral defense system
VLAKEEILAEKIRAILTREQPRDLYDAYHLLSKGVEVDRELFQDKLDYYDLVFEPDAVVAAAQTLKTHWVALDALTYSSLPPFDVAVSSLENALA